MVCAGPWAGGLLRRVSGCGSRCCRRRTPSPTGGLRLGREAAFAVSAYGCARKRRRRTAHPRAHDTVAVAWTASLERQESPSSCRGRGGGFTCGEASPAARACTGGAAAGRRGDFRC